MAENATIGTKSRTGSGIPESTRGGHHFTPRVDIYETDEELLLFADVPGVSPENVDLRYERGELLLHARVGRSETADQQWREYEEGDFYRVFHIHESIDPTQIRAECKKGVLTVHLPKAESARPKQIKITGD